MDSVSSFMEADHDRLDALFLQFQTLKQTDLAKAGELFFAFQQGLERHIGWEENILFPLFERRTDMTSIGPTMVMREEHRRIKKTLHLIDESIARHATPSDTYDDELLGILCPHNTKEEQVLYPWIDGTLSSEEKTRVLTDISSGKTFGIQK